MCSPMKPTNYSRNAEVGRPCHFEGTLLSSRFSSPPPLLSLPPPPPSSRPLRESGVLWDVLRSVPRLYLVLWEDRGGQEQEVRQQHAPHEAELAALKAAVEAQAEAFETKFDEIRAAADGTIAAIEGRGPMVDS